MSAARPRAILAKGDGMIMVRASDVRVGETVTYPKARHLSFEVEEIEGWTAGDQPGVRFRSGGLSAVYADRDYVWVEGRA